MTIRRHTAQQWPQPGHTASARDSLGPGGYRTDIPRALHTGQILSRKIRGPTLGGVDSWCGTAAGRAIVGAGGDTVVARKGERTRSCRSIQASSLMPDGTAPPPHGRSGGGLAMFLDLILRHVVQPALQLR